MLQVFSSDGIFVPLWKAHAIGTAKGKGLPPREKEIRASWELAQRASRG
jgi:hypothetical protein